MFANPNLSSRKKQNYITNLAKPKQLTQVNSMRSLATKQVHRSRDEQRLLSSSANLKNLFCHLTNYAINKESENFLDNDSYSDEEGSK